MENRFDEIVRDVANQYINGVLFIDEKAFVNDVNEGSGRGDILHNAFNAAAVSRAFAESGKACGFYAPLHVADVEKCKSLVVKTDVVVLDWDLYIRKDSLTKEEEDQDEDNDTRGYYTIQLINCIVDDAAEEKLRVIFIYTGEPDIEKITNDVYNGLREPLKSSFNLNTPFEIHSSNIHIIVRLKPESNTNHTGFSGYVVKYEELPSFVVNSFSCYVKGLMPCFAMKSMTAIREVSAKVLKTFNAGLDPEYLGHQMALDNSDTAKSFIADVFCGGLVDLILDDADDFIDSLVVPWLNNTFEKERDTDLCGTRLCVSKNTLASFFKSRYNTTDLKERIRIGFGLLPKANKNKLKSNLSSLFYPDGVRKDEFRHQFAALSHNKNIFSSNKANHPLTLGTIVKEQGEEVYYLCIQQRCDAARVKKEGMNFVFLPLLTNKAQSVQVFDAISFAPGKVLFVPKASNSVNVFKFCPETEGGMIHSCIVDGVEVFTSVDGKRFAWEGELNEMFAQRIVAAFVGYFSRVGIDEAEWLRIEANS